MTHFKTARGYFGATFRDTYDTLCSIQESSCAAEPCLWLGVDKPECKHLVGNIWEEYILPDDVVTFSRMHLNRDQARKLANDLLYFAEHGYLFDPEICDHYRLEAYTGFCFGTKEREVCDCKGNREKCNFHR